MIHRYLEDVTTLEYDASKCTGCGRCVEVCPHAVFEMDGKKAKLHPDYVYLNNRLRALQAAIKHFLGDRQLEQFNRLYEEEFTRRILEARDH